MGKNIRSNAVYAEFTYNPQEARDERGRWVDTMGSRVRYNVGNFTSGTWRIESKLHWASFTADGSLEAAGKGMTAPTEDELSAWATVASTLATKWKGREAELDEYMRGDYFIRFGRLPRGNISVNHATGKSEGGLSVYRATFNPTNEEWEFADEDVDPAAMFAGLQGVYGPPQLVKGTVKRRGTDNEPVLEPNSVTHVAVLRITPGGFMLSDVGGKAKFAYNPTELRDTLGEWTGGGGAGPSVGTTKQGKPDAKFVDMNMGVTSYRGKPATDVKSAEGYYTSTRYKGWLTDLKAEAERYNVKLKDVVRVSGVWMGAVEPSASVWVNGSRQNILKLAKSMGAEYNQDGVMMFSDEDNGVGALYTMPGLKEADRDKAIKAMGKNGVSGGRVVQMRDGGYVLEVADEDGSLFDGVQALSKELGTGMFATPGSVSFLNAGEHYDKKPRPYQGTAQTHAHKELDPVAQSARKLRGAAKFALTFFADIAKQKLAPKDWGRDKKWAAAGVTVHKLPANHSLIMMRGGYMGDTPAPGEPVEVYNDQEQWQGTTDTGETLIALSGPLQSGLGQVNEGAQVIQVGTQATYEDAARTGVMRGMEVDASLVRCKHAGSRIVGKQQASTPDKGKDTYVGTQAKMSRAPSNDIEGYAVFYVPYHYNALEARDYHGKWVSGAGLGPGTYSPEHVSPSVGEPQYKREPGTGFPAGGQNMGADIGGDPFIGMGETNYQTSPAETAKLLGAAPEREKRLVRNMVARARGKGVEAMSEAEVKAARQWYYNAAQDAETLASHHGMDATEGSMLIAATSPQTQWGIPSLMQEQPKKALLTNQFGAERVADFWEHRHEFEIDVTPELAERVKTATKGKTDLQNYHGSDPRMVQGGNFLGKHKIEELPADAIANMKHDTFRGLDSNFAHAWIAVRDYDPDTLGGPKTRSFYNNIRNPEVSRDVTLDKFMLRMLSGHRDMFNAEVSNLSADPDIYKQLADPLIEVADEMGWKPHELQAVLWIQEHREAAVSQLRKEGVPDADIKGLLTNEKVVADKARAWYSHISGVRAGAINNQRKAEGLEPLPIKAGDAPQASYWKGRFYSDTNPQE